MRILPMMSRNNLIIYKQPNKAQAQFAKNNNDMLNLIQAHKYTGNVSVDLAYASMIDDSIANDLKSMNLIV